jgi:hypothetical protein
LEQRIDYAFRLCLSRMPGPFEKERIIGYYKGQKETIARNAASVDSLYPSAVEQIDRSEAAIWVSIASVILNMNEFITRI